MVDRVHRRAHQSAPWAPRVNRTRGHRRLTAGPHAARRSGGRERGREGGKRRRSTAHPGATTATEEAAGVEGGGGAARVDGVSGVLAVGDGNRGVDEVGEDVVKPEETTLRRGTVPAIG
uniref:Pr1-like protein n=1 Tax=Oryza sativa subsp. indica TaxID=39946 RepID=C8TFN5_ORYSI|nr:pr1-like protein [Oryza sativa Indica Group]